MKLILLCVWAELAVSGRAGRFGQSWPFQAELAVLGRAGRFWQSWPFLAELAVSGSTKTDIKFKYEIQKVHRILLNSSSL
jgi:hypothetical protein